VPHLNRDKTFRRQMVISERPTRVSVGLAQTPCAGQLLPQRPERVAHDRAQQTQERSEAPLDHRRLLDAGYPVVML